MKNLEAELQGENRENKENQNLHSRLKRLKKSRLYLPFLIGFTIYEIATKGALIYWACDKVYDKFIRDPIGCNSSSEAYAGEMPRNNF